MPAQGSVLTLHISRLSVPCTSLQQEVMVAVSSRHSWHGSPLHPLHLDSMQLLTPSSGSAFLHSSGGSTECQWSLQQVWILEESSRHSWHCSPPHPWQDFSTQVFTSSSQAHCRPSAPYMPAQGSVLTLHISRLSVPCTSLQQEVMVAVSSRHSWHGSPLHPLHLDSMQLLTPSSGSAFLHSSGGSTECQWSLQQVWILEESSRHNWHCSPPHPWQDLSTHVFTSSSQAHCRPSAPYMPAHGSVVAAAWRHSKEKSMTLFMPDSIGQGIEEIFAQK